MTIPYYVQLAVAQAKKSGKGPFTGSLLSFDPGETTGWSEWKGYKMVNFGELSTSSIPDASLHLYDYIGEINPDFIVTEEYRVYGHKTQDHAWSPMHTSRLIGAIECIAALQRVPVIFQGAGQAKGFAKDEKLKNWDLWKKGQRHARDSIRHALYWFLFNYPKEGEGRNVFKARKTKTRNAK